MVVVKITHVQTHFAKGQLNRKLLSALHIAANGQTQSAPPLFDDMKKNAHRFSSNDNCSTFLQMCYAPDAQLH